MKQTEEHTEKEALTDLLNDVKRMKAITGWGTILSSVAMITGLGHANDVGIQDPNYLPFLVGGAVGAIGTIVMGAGRLYYHLADNRNYGILEESERIRTQPRSLMERIGSDMFPLESRVNDPVSEELRGNVGTDIKDYVRRYN